MSAPLTYHTQGLFVAEWELLDESGQPALNATVVGIVAQPPPGADANMVVTADGNIYRATFSPTMPGLHAWKLYTVGSPVGAQAGEFVVSRDQLGLPPIQLDPGQPVGLIRTMISDVDEISPLLTDAQIEALLGTESGNVKLGAAACLEAIARSEVLIAKKITTVDGASADGPAVAQELRASAKQLRDQVAKDKQDAEDDADDALGFGFDSVDNVRGIWWVA